MVTPQTTSRYTDGLRKALDIIVGVNDKYILPHGSKNWEVERALDKVKDKLQEEINGSN